MSFVFKKDTSVKNDRTLTSGVTSLKVEPFNKTKDLERDPETGLAYPYISIKAKGNFREHSLEWEMYAPTSTFKMQSSKYSEAFTQLMDIIDREKTLPVLTFYSDSFPHIESKKVEANKKLNKLRNFGYYQWNEESACSSVWIDKFEKIWKEWDRRDRVVKDLKSRITNDDTLNKKIKDTEAERDRLANEINAIKDCLRNFTENDPVMEIQDLFLDIYDEELCIENTQGDSSLFRKLPAGYKRLLYMVLDIAYRSYILNETTQSAGIVFIDEIDLHLHPSLEQSVLKRLSDTFPNIQFIVSTHSALVIANLDASISENGIQKNKVYMMQAGTKEPILLPNLYGVDYNAAMRDFMKTPDRNEDIKQLIDEFLTFKSIGMETEAESTYEKITEIVGEDSTILKNIDEQLNQL